MYLAEQWCCKKHGVLILNKTIVSNTISGLLYASDEARISLEKTFLRPRGRYFSAYNY
jgi:hypothetical protein